MSESLFVGRNELVNRLGVTLEEFEEAMPELRELGFPWFNEDFPARFYWPAVKAFFDRRNALAHFE